MEINQTPFILKKLRKTCRISQIHLALTLDMDQASISRLEKGTQGITLDILVKPCLCNLAVMTSHHLPDNQATSCYTECSFQD